jgi:predicted unusual protein kinase regulating ubiquinone biosynthesis (AarF/ABC1/UbiB family)
MIPVFFGRVEIIDQVHLSSEPAGPSKFISRSRSLPGDTIQLHFLEASMQSARLRARYRHIMGFFARTAASVVLWELVLPRLGLRGLTRRTRAARYKSIAANFRAMAIRMGGVMIKVGQFLSARLDILPAEITGELSGLQDEVPAEDFAAIRKLAEAEFGMPLEARFERFEPDPLAAASLGQVHRARLRTAAPEAAQFQEVVVKIQRPFIDQLIEVDFSALRRFGGWLQKYKPIGKRVNVPALIEELSETVHREIDYLAEGGNAEAFALNFKGRKRVHVPRVAWSHTTKRALTLENVYAIKITDYEAITAAGIDRAEVASVLLDTYLKQIFEDGFFHADPHPGNLFVTPVPAAQRRKAGWQLTFVDFGMVGTVPENLRDGLRDLLIGIGTRDPDRVVKSYQTLGVLLPGADIKLLEQAEAQLFERFWGKSMSELRKVNHAEMAQFAVQFRELMYEMPFQLPHNLLLLGRTVAILSGMCTGLDPNFNIWEGLAPYAQKLVADEVGSNWEVWLDEIGELVRQLVALPAQTGRVLTRLERGELNVNMPQVNRQIYHLEGAINRLTGSVIFAAFLFGGVLLYRAGDSLLGYAFWSLAGLTLLWMAFLSGGHSPWR